MLDLMKIVNSNKAMEKTIEIRIVLTIDDQCKSAMKDANDTKRLILNGVLKRSLLRQQGVLKANLIYKEYGKTN